MGVKKTKQAWINWSREEKSWVLRLYDEKSQSWEFSSSWRVDEEDDMGCGRVHDSILCEIAHLQDIGYDVKVTV